MPLPSMNIFGAKQCSAKSKRTGKPCLNPAAYGCKTCRVHGARKKQSIKRGEQHPNYVHGRRTLEAEKEHSETSFRLQKLEETMHLLGMTTAKRSSGRKSKINMKLSNFKDTIKKRFNLYL